MPVSDEGCQRLRNASVPCLTNDRSPVSTLTFSKAAQLSQLVLQLAACLRNQKLPCMRAVGSGPSAAARIMLGC